LARLRPWRPSGATGSEALGATLFLVGQQSRSNEAAGVGDFDFGRDFRSLRNLPADNLLAVKLSYWLGL
jgi:hypothetical protein